MIKQKRFLLLFIWILVLLNMVGCAKLERNYPVRNYYILSVADKNPNKSPVYGNTLEVDRLQISPSFSGREFVYRKGDSSYESDFYNQFFRAPVLLITDETRKWFLESGPFKNVVNSNVDVDANFTLQGNVTELYGDFRTAVSPKAVLRMQFLLTDDSSSNPKIIFQNNYRKEIPLETNSPESLVKGWNEALKQILTELEDDMRKADLKAER